MADLVIVAVIPLDAIIGFRRGFVVPLVAQGGELLTARALLRSVDGAALPSGTAGPGMGVAALRQGLGDLRHGNRRGFAPRRARWHVGPRGVP